AVVDPIQVLAEHLLRRFRAERDGVCAKQDAILIPVEESSRRSRLSSEFADACADLDVNVRESVERVADRLQVFGPVADVQRDERRSRVPRKYAIASLEDFSERRKVLVVERPVGMRVELF